MSTNNKLPLQRLAMTLAQATLLFGMPRLAVPLSVADEGTGMPEDALAGVFEYFYQEA